MSRNQVYPIERAVVYKEKKEKKDLKITQATFPMTKITRGIGGLPMRLREGFNAGVAKLMAQKAA